MKETRMRGAFLFLLFMLVVLPLLPLPMTSTTNATKSYTQQYFAVSGQAWGTVEGDYTDTWENDSVYFAGNITGYGFIVLIDFGEPRPVTQVRWRVRTTDESQDTAYLNIANTTDVTGPGEYVVDGILLGPGAVDKTHDWTGYAVGRYVWVDTGNEEPVYIWAGIDYAVQEVGDQNLTVWSGSVSNGSSESTISCCDGEVLNVTGSPANFTVHRWNAYAGLVRCDINFTSTVSVVTSWDDRSTHFDFGEAGWTYAKLYAWRDNPATENVSFMTTKDGWIAIDCIEFRPVAVSLVVDAVQTDSSVEVNVASNDTTLTFTLVLAWNNGSVIGRTSVGVGITMLDINASGDYRVLLYWAGPTGTEHYVTSASFVVSLPPFWEAPKAVDYTPLYVAIGISVAAIAAALFLAFPFGRRWRK